MTNVTVSNFGCCFSFVRNFCLSTKCRVPLKKGGKTVQRVYSWGFAGSGALGTPKLDQLSEKFAAIHPYNLMFFKNNNLKILAVSGGCGFSLFATSDKKLYGCGVNTDSQLGFQKFSGKIADYIREPVVIESLDYLPPGDTVIDVSAGRAHTLILTNSNRVFSFGNNSYGQCGRPAIHDEEYRGSQVFHEIDIGERVIRVFAGQDHSLLLTEKGHVFSFGISTDGQLGRKCRRGFDWEPKLISGLLSGVRVKHLSSRSDTVLALSEDGYVFGWGNNEYGQIQHTSNSETQLLEPVVLPMTNAIVSCAAGGTSCVAVEHSGTVLSWGFGALGRGPDIMQDSNPKPIPSTLFGKNEFNFKSKPVKVSAGLGFFLVSTEAGELYSWGRNKLGCCGLGHKEPDQFFPLKVSLAGRVRLVSCGFDHVICVVF